LIFMVVTLTYIPANSILWSFFPTSSPTFTVVYFLDVAILTGMRWNFSVLISISFMAKEVEHFSMCLLANFTSSFKNFYSIHSPIYQLDYLFFWCLLVGALYTYHILILYQINS
jgi:hypothetical protein